ncbi:hypothetical protein E2C01_038456 [Portunus trituberculatus]|uniref:Uncharacterized protein n=1 Tax=Portunus trituberculatus TaxID=210409 RepID=A0A5B7FHA6_PORTR|nr:hypothetical protein [Portunus trituberculatus]
MVPGQAPIQCLNNGHRHFDGLPVVSLSMTSSTLGCTGQMIRYLKGVSSLLGMPAWTNTRYQITLGSENDG